MRMGNHLCCRALLSHTMAATNHSVGIAHVTVVPTNAAAAPGEDDADENAEE